MKKWTKIGIGYNNKPAIFICGPDENGNPDECLINIYHGISKEDCEMMQEHLDMVISDIINAEKGLDEDGNPIKGNE